MKKFEIENIVATVALIAAMVIPVTVKVVNALKVLFF